MPSSGPPPLLTFNNTYGRKCIENVSRFVMTGQGIKTQMKLSLIDVVC